MKKFIGFIGSEQVYFETRNNVVKKINPKFARFKGKQLSEFKTYIKNTKKTLTFYRILTTDSDYKLYNEPEMIIL